MESMEDVLRPQTCPRAIVSKMTSCAYLNDVVGKESCAVLMNPHGIPVHLALFSTFAAVSLILYSVRLFFCKEQRDEDAPSFPDILFFR